MIDYARVPAPDVPYHEPPPLDHFDTLRKKWTVSYSYGNYYSAPAPYDNYAESELTAATSVYHDLVAPREPPPPAREPWHYRYVSEWSEDDTASWLLETLRYNGIDEYDFPFFHFRVPGVALRGLKKEQIVQLLSNPSRDPAVSRRTGEIIYEKLQQVVGEEMRRYAEYEYAPHESVGGGGTMLDLDAQEPRAPPRHYPSGEDVAGAAPLGAGGGADSSSEAEDGSAECSYASDGSKSGDEELARRVLKRPPGRPRGSGRTLSKRPRSVSVPEFLRNLLLDPNYCPTIIKWEDHSQGKFRFVKPDEVAKLWGKLKQNDNMTFEKFSRAMRYHYRQAVLVSVPTARLVYQFGHKGPDFRTDNPNFLRSDRDAAAGSDR